MKNKTLTLLIPIILISSLFSACSIEKKITISTNADKENIKNTQLQNISIDEDALNKAISKSILDTNERLEDAELKTEGHIILGTETNQNFVTTFIIAGVSNYRFENDTFVSTSATGAIPTIIRYEVNPENNRYTEIDYQEPNKDNFQESVYKMFPEQFHDKVLNADLKYPEIEKMQLLQAKEYIHTLGRDVEIKTYLKKDDLPVNLEVFSANFKNFPTWEGTVEILENADRFIYESKITEINSEIYITCTQKDAKGNTLESFLVDTSGNFQETIPHK
ncbi:MAG: hypothetical protein ACRC41_10090 [Sarcina sp.]